ncbi:hypothetical protein BBP40_000548 [Aspergillus hancockii]|nr:hypothetical protein BBP40_000548 [Aspergillus hancockii]
MSIITASFAIDRPAIKDSTIFQSTMGCVNCPDNDCYKCTRGHENTLQASTGGLPQIRSLIGFQLPVASTSVKACTVQFPAFTTYLQTSVNITVSRALSSSWDEDTITAENTPESSDVFRQIEVEAYANMGAIDITPACQRADADGNFSIYLGTRLGWFEIWSKDARSPAVLHITTSS